MARIKNRDKLLSDISEGLKALPSKAQIGNIQVTFHCYDGAIDDYTFDLVHAMDALTNDLHFDERGDWSEALKAQVGQI